ncbi:MAG: hypothetical protein CVV27_20270 [Candidatus Melainabacteria bacterium HGW-Melainabacteria-1]|jgi:hypothetical protein|nr:MAG: hypothetical protein CVV47_00485 [Spirochaetae bacterium HGW-Spirochaetae-3]PKL74485.1 MAG: hypothetical protein CVV27_20270 [Candidatus Melainabacteria bacterium HGW-Melainabacteria-1]
MKKSMILTVALALCATAAFGQTATKYFVAHQGGYIGEATVTVKRAKVVSASISEWQGPGGWAENNAPDGKSLVDGAVVRVPDPLANTTNADPAIKGYMFYIYNVQNGVGVWSQFTPAKDGFVRPSRQYERDFEGLMGNPIRAAAYAKAAREDTLVNVTIDGLKVIVGKPASQTVHYGNMDKANPAATYMELNASSIGYRYNSAATIAFFMANPTADYTSFTMMKAKVALTEDKGVDAKASVADYTAETDSVFAVADAVTGATYSDFPHYSLELQAAYKMALAEGKVKFKK